MHRLVLSFNKEICRAYTYTSVLLPTILYLQSKRRVYIIFPDTKLFPRFIFLLKFCSLRYDLPKWNSRSSCYHSQRVYFYELFLKAAKFSSITLQLKNKSVSHYFRSDLTSLKGETRGDVKLRKGEKGKSRNSESFASIGWTTSTFSCDVGNRENVAWHSSSLSLLWRFCSI